MLQQEALEMRELTLRLMQGSVKPIVVGVEGINMNSGELVRKGMDRFAVFLAPLDKLLLRDAHLDEALLLV
jgi:hypothetical protein